MKKNDKLLLAYSQAPDKLQGSATGLATVDKMYMRTLSLYMLLLLLLLYMLLLLLHKRGNKTQKDIIKESTSAEIFIPVFVSPFFYITKTL